MSYYQRKNPVKAVQFIEKEYAIHPVKYPEVHDKAMLSELWWNKTAKDGRYHIPNIHSHSFVLNATTVYEGDYILTEESGYIHVIPQEIFEKDYESLTGSEGLE